MLENFIISVVFDGVCVYDQFPHTGKDVPLAATSLRSLVDRGARIILNTAGDRDRLLPGRMGTVIRWFTTHGISLYDIDRNPEQAPTDQKLTAHLFIDTRCVGAPLLYDPEISPLPVIDWPRALAMIDALVFTNLNLR